MRLRMSTPTEVRRTIQRIANMMLNEEIEIGRGKAIIYACNVILCSIRIDEQEKRINEIEEILADQKG